MIKKLVLVLTSITAISIFSTQATSATLNVVDGELVGSSNVLVNGSFYDVEFIDGTCASVFSGCDQLSDFTFNSDLSADAASQALLDQVFSSFGLYDVYPALTRGIESVHAGNLNTPYGFVTPSQVRLDSAVNFANFYVDMNGCFLGTCSVGVLFDLSTSAHNAYARWTAVAPVPTPITIDIKPGSDPNCFNINSQGVIPVAILGSDSFDVTQIAQDSLSFGGLEVRVRGNKGSLCQVDYSDDDEYLDLVCQFEDNSENWNHGEGEATLTGSLINEGGAFEGTDSICVVP